MPSAPITGRTLLWEFLPDGTTIHQLDWNLVETSLGTMVEPRIMNRGIFDDIKNEDLSENGYTAILKLSSKDLYTTYNFIGTQWPHFRAGDPGPFD
jgi:hypothetical protein